MELYYLIKKQRKFYKNIKYVYSPALKCNVYFTAKGFRHLIYEGTRAPRSENEQILKLLLLEYAPDIISKAKIIANKRIIQRVNNNSKVVHISLENTMLIGIRARVILEKSAKGRYIFLSIMRVK